MSRPSRRRAGRERGNTLVIAACFMMSLLMLLMVWLDEAQVNQARMMIDAAVQAAAVDGVRADAAASMLVPPCETGGHCTPPVRRLAVRDSEALRLRVRDALERGLASVAYLMEGTTPAEVAATAEIAVVTPGGWSRCQPSPFPGPSGCYTDPFVAVRVTVPMQLLWGAVSFKYQAVAVGATTDNELEQLGATPIPTPRPAVVPTWSVPRPTCDPRICSASRP